MVFNCVTVLYLCLNIFVYGVETACRIWHGCSVLNSFGVMSLIIFRLFCKLVNRLEYPSETFGVLH